ncbi:MAG: AI-2E family transporter [Lachnospiraceae bacterium]
MQNNNNTEEKNETLFNKKYASVSFYAILVILAGMLIYKAIIDWNSVYGVIQHILKVLSPFIWGFGFAFVLNPLVEWFSGVLHKITKSNKNRLIYGISLMITYIMVIGFLILMLIFVVPQIYSSLVDLTNIITKQYFIIMEKLSTAPDNWHNINVDSVMAMINNSIPQLVGYISGITTNLIPFIYNTSLTVLKGLTNALLGIIISIYMLADKKNLIDTFRRFTCAVVPTKGSETFFSTLRESTTIFSKYITGKTLDSFIIGCITSFIMTVFQLDFVLLISVTVAVTNMIPYFGPFIGGFVGVIILLIENPVNALIFGIIILFIQQFDGLYLGPKILGESTGLKPLWVIFAIIVGGSLFGVMGMLIGVPCVAVLSYMINRFVSYRLDMRNVNYRDGRAYSINKKNKNQPEE